ncbi:MAG: tRNA 2-selenouridine(34) synthase MnmH, partial [Candidatus Hydrogenedentota bacterium]
EIPVLDVRSPAEYQKGHIIHAISFPLFSDEERAIVGTLYKKEGKQRAIQQGLDFVGQRLKEIYESAYSIAGESKKLLVYCWRGGMRSNSVAHFLSGFGFEVGVLIGGYKNYRRELRNAMERKLNSLIVLGGLTGSGKTEILSLLKEYGEQVIDLEGIANHKGSAFGLLPNHAQPTQEMFENGIGELLLKFDDKKPIWIEDESAKIGKLYLPQSIYKAIRNATVIRIDVEKEVRIKRLVQEYGKESEDWLLESTKKIQKKLGGTRLQQIIQAIQEHKNFELAASLLLEYYDKTYTYGLSKRSSKTIIPFSWDWLRPNESLQKLVLISKNLTLKSEA